MKKASSGSNARKENVMYCKFMVKLSIYCNTMCLKCQLTKRLNMVIINYKHAQRKF